MNRIARLVAWVRAQQVPAAFFPEGEFWWFIFPLRPTLTNRIIKEAAGVCVSKLMETKRHEEVPAQMQTVTI